MYNKKKAVFLDVTQLEFVKAQTGLHLHEMIGKTIIISFTGGEDDLTTTSAHKIIGATTDHYDNSPTDGRNGWRVNVTLESGIIRNWRNGDEKYQIAIEALNLYIRRENTWDFEATVIKTSSTGIEVMGTNLLGSYHIF